jgi:hypothetical protein
VHWQRHIGEQGNHLLTWLGKIIEDPRTDRAIMLLIVLNALTLGIETSERAMAQFGTLLRSSAAFTDKPACARSAAVLSDVAGMATVRPDRKFI